MGQELSESLKPAAIELANLIRSKSDDTCKMTGLLALLDQSSDVPENDKKPELQSFIDTRSIGIWKLADDKGCYERDANQWEDWHSWANVDRFFAGKSKKRIVLLGESVARGVFYNPYYTVANELEAIMNKQEEMDCEVVDLAKSSMTMNELSLLALQSRVLEPDVLVVFAGNNWHIHLGDALEADGYGSCREIFKEGSLSGLAPYLEEKLQEKVKGFFKVLGDIRQGGIPVVFLVPGFNLRDWKSDEAERILPWMHDNTIAEWLEACEEAQSAHRKGQWSFLRTKAKRMVELDPYNPLGHELLGESYVENGELTEARASFERARDTAMFEKASNTRPRCLEAVRKAIKSEAALYDIVTVDLAVVFADSLKGGVPDRRLFLDYCHLTIEGIKIAMRHTASALMQVLTRKYTAVEDLRASGLDPNEEIQAIAHFSAAIHNSHGGQPFELVKYHCEKAISLSGQIRENMLLYIDFASRSCPTAFCKSFERLISGGTMKQYESGMGLIHNRNSKLMDIELVNGMLLALESAGVYVRDKIETLRMKQHSIGDAGRNLLQSYYCATSYNRFSHGPYPDYLQVRSIRSFFSFFADADSEITIRMVYRTPGRDYPDMMVRVMLNAIENVVFQAPMSSQWKACSFTIDKGSMARGLNRLIVQWPYTSEALAEFREERASRRSFASMMYPVLGEIHALLLVKHAI